MAHSCLNFASIININTTFLKRLMTISNYGLVELADKYGISLSINDIIMSDELNKIPKTRVRNIVLNTKSSLSEEGQHWVALAIRGKHALYFDSFGAVPDTGVIKYCKARKLNLGYSNYVVQDLDSSDCGLFCFGLFLHLARETTDDKSQPEIYALGNEYVNRFHHIEKRNDAIIAKYLKDS